MFVSVSGWWWRRGCEDRYRLRVARGFREELEDNASISFFF